MAATSAWGKPGAWALDSEEHEDELKQEATNGRAPAAAMSDFPDLMTAASTKTKKKKGQTLSLGEFVNNKSTTQTYQAAKGLTAEDMMMLPTGPRQRTAEELDRTRLGGGFRSYGGDNRSNESSNSRWSSNRSNGGEDRPSREPLGPSRADETDDWGAGKKSSTIGGDRRERGGGGGGGGFFEGGSHSRADESDSWGSNKPEGRKMMGGGDRERRMGMGFELSGEADTSDNWGRKKEVEGRRFGGGSSAFDSIRERRVAAGNDSSSDMWKKREEFGGGSVSRPKLNLQPRKSSSSVVGDAVDVEEAVKPAAAKGSNPFGDARPREEVLKKMGVDWKEIDEKLDSVKHKDLGSGDQFRGRPRSNEEDSTEKSWRKNPAAAADVDASSPSGEKSENGHEEKAEAEEALIGGESGDK